MKAEWYQVPLHQGGSVGAKGKESIRGNEGSLEEELIANAGRRDVIG